MFIAVFVLCVCLLILVVLSLGSGMCVLCGGARASLVAVSRLQSMRSVVVARGLGFSAACGIPVPRSGIEPISPALEYRFLTTGPPRKFLLFIITSNKCSLRKMRIRQEGKKTTYAKNVRGVSFVKQKPCAINHQVLNMVTVTNS